LLKAEKYSLILLDEPETSLHPGAQKRLIAFLLEQIRTKHLQIVISTHSPTIVETLPQNAVKVLEIGDSGRARIVENTHPQVAFNRL
jgi:predicted ATPase